MEKYDIPEENSLDSMEGIENNIELDIEKKAFERMTDILEYGTALTGLFPTLRKIDKDTQGNWGVYDEFYTDSNNPTKIYPDSKRGFSKLDESNVREYLSQKDFSLSIIDVLLYGIQSDSKPRSGKIKSGDKRTGYNPDKIARDKLSYRKKISEIKEIYGPSRGLGGVYFNIIGRDEDIGRQRLKRYPESWDDYEQSTKNPFQYTQWTSGGVSVVFETPKKEIEQDVWPKFGQFGPNEVGRYTRYWEEMKAKYPDIKPGDKRILEWLEIQKENITKIKNKEIAEPEHLFTETFSSKGEPKVSNDLGFILKGRVPPRKIKGIVINFDAEKDTLPNNTILAEDINVDTSNLKDSELFELFQKEIEKMSSYRDRDEWRKKHYNVLLKRLINIMIEVGKRDETKVVPIYNYRGDMLWPRKIDHKEIIKMK